MSRRFDRCKSFTKGVFLGGIAMGITALLFAPKSGKKLRKDVKRTYDDVSGRTRDKIDDLYEQSKGLAKETKRFVKKVKRK